MAIPADILGRVLASLQIRRRKGIKNRKPVPSNHLSEAEEKLLEKMQDRLTELADSSNQSRVFNQLTNYRCQTDDSLLRGNIDFFLICLFLHLDKPSSNCEKFFKHLNNCYECFEEFTEVMRSYFNRLAELDREDSLKPEQ